MKVDKMQEKDYMWFKDNYAELYKKYGDAYIAIKNQKVLGKYSSYAEGVKNTALSEPMGTFIIQHCNGKESGYTNYIASLYISGKGE